MSHFSNMSSNLMDGAGGGNMLTYVSLLVGVVALVMAIISFIKKSTAGPKGDKGDKGAKGDDGSPLMSDIVRYRVDLDQTVLQDKSGSSEQDTAKQLSHLSIADANDVRASMIMNNPKDNGSIEVEIGKDRLIIKGHINMHDLVVATIPDIIKITATAGKADLSFQIHDDWFIPTEDYYVDLLKSSLGLLTYSDFIKVLRDGDPVVSYATARRLSGDIVDHKGSGVRQEEGEENYKSSTHFTMIRDLIIAFDTTASTTTSTVTLISGTKVVKEEYIIEFRMEYSLT
jgi:hypothetical protein